VKISHVGDSDRKFDFTALGARFEKIAGKL
jgi:hypothetical protein